MQIVPGGTAEYQKAGDIGNRTLWSVHPSQDLQLTPGNGTH